jgi:hypothetical protein
MYDDFVKTGNLQCNEMLRRYGSKKIKKFANEMDKRDEENKSFVYASPPIPIQTGKPVTYGFL